MRLLLLLFIVINAFSSEDISELLTAYHKASELSEKTKNESAGNLIVYTRDDLERMQAQTLKDITKSLRFFKYAENRMAQPDMLNKDPILYKSMPIRIYLNDRELISALFGSGNLWFGDIELDFIDHIEIYEGFPSLNVGVEPSKVSIRLYSKSVEHDEGGRVKLMGGSQGVNAQNVYYADRIDEIDFFLYAGRYDDKRLSIENSGDLDRNKYKKRLIGSIGTDNHHLEFQALEQKSDTFLGPAIAGTPLKAKGELNYFDLGWSSRFLDQSLIANVAYSRGAYTMNSAYDQEIIPNTQITAFDQEHIDEVLSVQVKKIVNLDDHKLTIGAEYRNKSFALESLAFNGVSRPITQTYDAQQILAFFLQDDYTLDENKLLTLSMMYQAYDNNAPEIKDHTTHQIRAGYIYTSHEWVSKTFIASQEFAPEPYMLSKSFQGNSNLDTMKSLYAMQEFIVDVNRASLHVIFGYVENSDIIIKSNAMTDNAQNTSYVNTQAIELKQTFLEDDTLDVNLFRSEHSSAINDDRELIYGITLRMLNSIDAFDFFNELVILEGYSEGTGYDYSLGARYHASDDLTFSIKGENVFDTGLEWSYISQMPPNKETVKASAIEQRFWAGLEFLF